MAGVQKIDFEQLGLLGEAMDFGAEIPFIREQVQKRISKQMSVLETSPSKLSLSLFVFLDGEFIEKQLVDSLRKLVQKECFSQVNKFLYNFKSVHTPYFPKESLLESSLVESVMKTEAVQTESFHLIQILLTSKEPY